MLFQAHIKALRKEIASLQADLRTHSISFPEMAETITPGAEGHFTATIKALENYKGSLTALLGTRARGVTPIRLREDATEPPAPSAHQAPRSGATRVFTPAPASKETPSRQPAVVTKQPERPLTARERLVKSTNEQLEQNQRDRAALAKADNDRNSPHARRS